MRKKPKCILIFGSPASGKTSFYDELKIDKNNYNYLNVDKYVEDENGDCYNNLAKASSKIFKDDLPDNILSGQDIILDTTGSSFKRMQGINFDLLYYSYDISCHMIYVDPVIALIRNKTRKRILPAFVILNEWCKVYSNINHYKLLFHNKFSLHTPYTTPPTLDINERMVKEKLDNYIEEIGGLQNYTSTFRKTPLTAEELVNRYKQWDSATQSVNQCYNSIIKNLY